MSKQEFKRSGRVKADKVINCTTHHHACACREAMYKSTIKEAIEEIEYWHSDMILEGNNGWARVYSKLKSLMNT